MDAEVLWSSAGSTMDEGVLWGRECRAQENVVDEGSWASRPTSSASASNDFHVPPASPLSSHCTSNRMAVFKSGCRAMR